MDEYEVKRIIKEAIPDANVEVITEDNRHYEAIVTSKTFEGKSMVEQHQIVLNALKDALKSGLHAIAIKTRVPE
ncbi:MAG: BolA/IbaG family iron-sulfur metabolism protein [Candidatus Nanoarchaeia archaeon]